MTPEEQQSLLTPYNNLITSINGIQTQLDARLVSWFNTEIAAGRADLTRGFTNTQHNDTVVKLNAIYQLVNQYRQFMMAYFIADPTMEYEAAKQVVFEYFAGLQQMFDDFKALNGF